MQIFLKNSKILISVKLYYTRILSLYFDDFKNAKKEDFLDRKFALFENYTKKR